MNDIYEICCNMQFILVYNGTASVRHDISIAVYRFIYCSISSPYRDIGKDYHNAKDYLLKS